MKKLIFLTSFLFLIIGCDDKNVCDDCQPVPGKFGIRFTQNNKPFVGIMELFPCEANTTTYFGNYFNGTLSVINPAYLISDGNLAGANRPVDVPKGDYDMIYWGIDQSIPVASGVSRPGPLRLGMDMKTGYWALHSDDGSIYTPAYNLVYATKEVMFPFENVTVDLVSVVAGLDVLVRNEDGSAFDDEIVSIDVLIDNVAKRLDYGTGEPDFSEGTVIVNVPLIIADDRLTASVPRILLYPSSDVSTITVVLQRSNRVDVYVKSLGQLVANTNQQVTIDLD